MRVAIGRVWVCAGFAALFASISQAGDLPPGFVRLASVDPSIHQDIRYASRDNFVGRVIPGYEAGECWLRREAAHALSHVQADLAKNGFELVVYDCYRPLRAVKYFIEWSRDPSDQLRKAEYYPSIDKSKLFAAGYLAVRSAHSKGIAVDAGLTRRAGLHAQNQNVDLGTPFDFLHPLAETRSRAISNEAIKNRYLLTAAMARHGFQNYYREWWHFTLTGVDRPESSDVPIRP